MQKNLTYKELRSQLPEELRKTADMEINLTENIFFGEDLSEDEFEVLETIKKRFHEKNL